MTKRSQSKGMVATESHIIEFQELCRSECGVELTVEEAREYYDRTIDLYRAIYKPIPNSIIQNQKTYDQRQQ